MLTLALIFVSNRIEPVGSPVPTSQIVGVAKPFKPEPERSPYTITGTNFAAAYKPTSARAADKQKPVRRADAMQRQQPAEADRVPRWKRIAQNPIAELMSIH